MLMKRALPQRVIGQLLRWASPGVSRNLSSTIPPLTSELRRPQSTQTTPQWHAGPKRYASTNGSGAPKLARTALYDLHVAHGATMVPFGGYSMPVQYSDLGLSLSHRWTREKASLFDVGHMVQHRFSGSHASSFLEKISPASIKNLQVRHSTLSCFLHPQTGGIVDDTVITRLESNPDLFYVVTNAGCRNKDLEYLSSQIAAYTSESGCGSDAIEWEVLDSWGLVALQGPLSAEVLQSMQAKPEEIDLKTLYFGQCAYISLKLLSGESTRPVLASRGGYTGEDGFEISIPPELTVPVSESLLKTAGPEKLRLAGLGARDSLRLEAGMCLYGHDLDNTTTPVEAGLSWVIGKDRRASGGFHGDGVILSQMKTKKQGGTGVERRRVGFIVRGAPAREGADVVPAEGDEVIGKITSGCPSPTLGKNIAMGYIKSGFHTSGTVVGVIVRGKKRPAEVVKMPFVPSKYWKQFAGISPA